MPWCSNTARGRRSRQLLVTKAVCFGTATARCGAERIHGDCFSRLVTCVAQCLFLCKWPKRKHFHGSLRASIARVEQVPLPEVPRATRAISSASQQVE
ncbi:hypothetical protein PoMZ_02628 [Pyricularia oryzae]|uniref:Uncharacterized protein n=1 Tax=Pyricularia oryzae TaxID=318829 RepID=A0A4P7N5S0_PYROR|nr:hypothetical protein PoMZ_02628 [Pyricularia oryzae]